MTDHQAKQIALASMQSEPGAVLDLIFDHLFMTMSQGAATYLLHTGTLASTKTASSVKCELSNVLQSVRIDPGPLIVKKVGKRRVRISYKGRYLRDHVLWRYKDHVIVRFREARRRL